MCGNLLSSILLNFLIPHIIYVFRLNVISFNVVNVPRRELFTVAVNMS